jgi:hypothetical protein
MEYFTAIWSFAHRFYGHFGICNGHFGISFVVILEYCMSILVYCMSILVSVVVIGVFTVWYVAPRIIWQPCLGTNKKTPFLLRQLPASENYAMQLIAVIVAIKFLDVEKLFQ